jgi:hypothetical protein
MHRSALPGGQTDRSLLERRVRTTFLNVASALECRPEPRAVFDNAARRDGASRPWGSYADALRTTARAAHASNAATREATRELIVESLLAFAAYVLEPMDDGIPLDVVLFTRLVQEEAEAIDAQAIARGLGTGEARQAAIRETEEAIIAQRLYVVREKCRLTSTNRPLSLV